MYQFHIILKYGMWHLIINTVQAVRTALMTYDNHLDSES